MVSFGKKKSKATSGLDIRTLPGIFGGKGIPEELSAPGREIGEQLKGIIGGVPTEDVFRAPLEESILRPEFGPTSSSETALLDSIMSLTQGQSAVRGLGPSTQASLAQSIAPALIGLREKRVGELERGAGLDVQRRQQVLMSLMELAGLSMPQIIAGQKSKQRASGFEFGITPPK